MITASVKNEPHVVYNQDQMVSSLQETFENEENAIYNVGNMM